VPTRQRKSVRRKTASHKTARRGSNRYWSARVTRESNALDLTPGVFTLSDPKKIAASLKRSALQSHRRKADPYRSALSMLVFYINRAGKNLPESRRKILHRAKAELRRQFGRD
jgi:putative cell wall-binding protein